MEKIQTFAEACAEHEASLKKVLTAAGEAAIDRKRLQPEIAECNHGVYERVRWLRRAIRELPADGPVRVVKLSSTQNALRVELRGERVDFLMFFAKMDSADWYSIHNKGPQSEQRSGVQSTFPGMEITGVDATSEVHPYALRVERANDFGTWFELHMVMGSRNERSGILSDSIKAFDRYVLSDRSVEDEAKEPTYSPEVVIEEVRPDGD